MEIEMWAIRRISKEGKITYWNGGNSWSNYPGICAKWYEKYSHARTQITKKGWYNSFLSYRYEIVDLNHPKIKEETHAAYAAELKRREARINRGKSDANHQS